MKTKHLLIFFVALIAFVSCKKVPNIGSSLQPNSNFIKVAFSGDHDIVAETERIDSLNTKAASLSLVGDLNDPIFGKSNLSFYTQLGLTSNSAKWGKGATTDSIVLQMIYSGYYGDTLSSITLKVHEVAEKMSGDSMTYYSNTSFACGEELASYTFSPRPKTRSNIDDDSLTAAVVRIPIDNALGEKLINNEDQLTSNATFMNFFNGLYVSCEPTNETGVICYFNLLNSKSYLRIYYHNDYDTTFYDFNVSDKYIRFNHFEHDYSNAQAPITFNDTTNNEYLYVQSTAGVRSRLIFPNLAQWAVDMNTNVLINEAKLIMTGANGMINGVNNDTSMFTQPAQLVVVKANEDGSYSILPDQLVGTKYFNGMYDPKTDQVWFRISEYVQDLVLAAKRAETDTTFQLEDYGLFVYTYSGAYNAKRWIFHGPDSPDTTNRVKLEIIYSKIDD
ncbi:MAG: DUF4270 domain-containing protein [Bacteroidales bacterium]|nr:DUF4270 domain-containing protein [Bacteroidales bacterium]